MISQVRNRCRRKQSGTSAHAICFVFTHQVTALCSVKWRHGRQLESVTSNLKSDSVNRIVFTNRRTLCQLSSWSYLKRRSLGLFLKRSPQNNNKKKKEEGRISSDIMRAIMMQHAVGETDINNQLHWNINKNAALTAAGLGRGLWRDVQHWLQGLKWCVQSNTSLQQQQQQHAGDDDAESR